MNCVKYDYSTLYTNFVKQFRKSIGLTQQELAEKVGVSRYTITRIENHTEIPSIKLAYDIAYELGCNVYELFIFRKIVESY